MSRAWLIDALEQLKEVGQDADNLIVRDYIKQQVRQIIGGQEHNAFSPDATQHFVIKGRNQLRKELLKEVERW